MFGSPSDDALVRKALKGQADAWDKLIRRYEGRVYNFAMRMTGNRDDAMDLMQNIFLAVYRGLASFRGESEFSSWLFAIASFRTTDFYRRRRFTEDLDEGEMAEEGLLHTQSPFGHVVSKQRNKCVMQALAQLPEEQRLVVELKFFQDLTFDEISEQLGVSANTLKSRLYGALKKIKAMPEVMHVV